MDIRETNVRVEGNETYLDVIFESDDPGHVYGHSIPFSALGAWMVLLGHDDASTTFDFILNEGQEPAITDWSPFLEAAASTVAHLEDVEEAILACKDECSDLAPEAPLAMKRMERTSPPVSSIRERLTTGDLASLVDEAQRAYVASLMPNGGD